MSRYQQGHINKGRSPQNCIVRGCVSVKPSDAILRDDGLICFTVAVGEQGAALPQASLIKGRFGGIVNILLLIMIMVIIIINSLVFVNTVGVILER